MSNIYELPGAPADAISSVRFSPDGSRLLVGAWDSAVLAYKHNGESYTLTEKIQYDAPILDVCWNADGATFYSVGLDCDVVQYNVEQGAESRQVLSTHGEASNKVAYSKEHDVVISTSWDRTMHIHNASTRQFVPVKLDAKPFALALTAEHALVAMAERKVHAHQLSALKSLIAQAGGTADDQQPIHVEPWQSRESSLKFMTRAAACTPDGTGFASSSIEGRVAVEWFDAEMDKQKYAFKCHREKSTAQAPDVDGNTVPLDIIYPVNAVTFNPVHGTFATGGGDGVVAFWDAKTKRRIRQYPKLAASVADMDFSADGKSLAIGVSPGFEDGREEAELDPSLIKVYIRTLADNEARGKPAKEK